MRVFAFHRRVALVAALTGALLLPRAAAAHLGNVSYADLEVRGGVVLLKLKYAAHLTPGWPVPEGSPATRQQVLATRSLVDEWLGSTASLAANGEPCHFTIENLVGPDRNDDLEIHAFWSCDAPEITSLRLDLHPLASRLDDWQTIASLRLGASSYSTVLVPGATTWQVGDAGGTAAGNGDAAAAGGPDTATDSAFARFFHLGVEHIWTGYDHLLFLLAVLLAGGGIGRLAAIVTSFTVAHSITLGAAATGLVQLPVEPVEAAIALSIVYVAAENLMERGADRRALVTFAFGLVHGFGFASVLAETALPPGEVVVPLLAFNLGVEAGQLAVVVVVVPLLSVLLRGRHAHRVRARLSVLIALAGAAWAIERIASMLA